MILCVYLELVESNRECLVCLRSEYQKISMESKLREVWILYRGELK